MKTLEKTLLSIATAATLAGCLGSPEPKYVGPRKHDGTARVDSSATAQSDTAAVATPTRTAYDQTNDPELNLLDADKPFLIPRQQRYQPQQQRPSQTPEQELPRQERNLEEEYY